MVESGRPSSGRSRATRRPGRIDPMAADPTTRRNFLQGGTAAAAGLLGAVGGLGVAGPDAAAGCRPRSARDRPARHPGRAAQRRPDPPEPGGRPRRPAALPPLPLRPGRAGRQQVRPRQADPRLPRAGPAAGPGDDARPPEAPLEVGQRRQGVPPRHRGRHPRAAAGHDLLLLGLQRQHARPADRGQPGRPRPLRRPQPPARADLGPLPRHGTAQRHGRRRGPGRRSRSPRVVRSPTNSTCTRTARSSTTPTGRCRRSWAPSACS